jgi:hypothetical protein
MDDRHRDTQRFLEALGMVLEFAMILTALVGVGCMVWLLS